MYNKNSKSVRRYLLYSLTSLVIFCASGCAPSYLRNIESKPKQEETSVEDAIRKRLESQGTDPNEYLQEWLADPHFGQIPGDVVEKDFF